MKRKTPLRAIRAFCLECAGSSQEVALCTANEKDIAAYREAGDDTPYPVCLLYEYRFGHNPARKGVGAKIVGKSQI